MNTNISSKVSGQANPVFILIVVIGVLAVIGIAYIVLPQQVKVDIQNFISGKAATVVASEFLVTITPGPNSTIEIVTPTSTLVSKTPTPQKPTETETTEPAKVATQTSTVTSIPTSTPFPTFENGTFVEYHRLDGVEYIIGLTKEWSIDGNEWTLVVDGITHTIVQGGTVEDYVNGVDLTFYRIFVDDVEVRMSRGSFLEIDYVNRTGMDNDPNLQVTANKRVFYEPSTNSVIGVSLKDPVIKLPPRFVLVVYKKDDKSSGEVVPYLYYKKNQSPKYCEFAVGYGESIGFTRFVLNGNYFDLKSECPQVYMP
jgi:hypothetical protein